MSDRLYITAMELLPITYNDAELLEELLPAQLIMYTQTQIIYDTPKTTVSANTLHMHN